jgi:hypothetical protein
MDDSSSYIQAHEDSDASAMLSTDRGVPEGLNAHDAIGQVHGNTADSFRAEW